MLLAILIALVILNKALYKSYLNPIFLQSVLWLVYYWFLQSNIDEYDVYMRDVAALIVLQSIGFSIGGFVCLLFTRSSYIKTSQPAPIADLEQAYNNVNFLYPYVFVIIGACLFGLLREGASLSISGLSDIAAIRENLIEDQGQKYGLYGIIQFLVCVYFLVYFVSKPKNELKYWLLLFVFFVFTLVLNSKGGFLFFVAPLIYGLVWEKKVSPLYVLYGTIFITGLFVLITLMRFNGADSEFLYYILLVYTITSVPALVIGNKAASSPIVGYYTLRIPHLWLNKIGFSFAIPPVLAEFTATPLGANTYSYMKPYFIDFGIVGVFVFPLLLGIVTNFIYFKARSGRLPYIILTSLLIYPLIMQIFDEHYFLWMSNWAYFTIVTLLLTVVKVYKREIKSDLVLNVDDKKSLLQNPFFKTENS